jgi:hypothetical protein
MPWGRRHPFDQEAMMRLNEGTAEQRVEALYRTAPSLGVDHDAQLAAFAGLSDASAAQQFRTALLRQGKLRSMQNGRTPWMLHADVAKTLAEDALNRLQVHCAANPRSPGVPLGEWPGWMPRSMPAERRAVFADWLITEGLVQTARGFVSPAKAHATLPAEDQRRMSEISSAFRQAACKPPDVSELLPKDARLARRTMELIELAAARGELVRIADGILLHAEAWDALRQRVVDAIRSRGPITVADLRTLLDTTRKYAVPIAEALDAAGVTRRVGDQRVLGAAAEPPGRA